jgi:hypothetical protein
MSRIMALNPSVAVEFLAGFSDDRLANYLGHLLWAQNPRSATSPAWQDRDATAAIGCAESLD